MSDEQWATVELMGHGQTAGRITIENGLLRVDVPFDGTYRTEFYGMAAIYSIKIVSEEIAMAYAHHTRDIVAYDTPIVTREQHINVVNKLERRIYELERNNNELESRLVAIKSLPAPSLEDERD